MGITILDTGEGISEPEAQREWGRGEMSRITQGAINNAHSWTSPPESLIQQAWLGAQECTFLVCVSADCHAERRPHFQKEINGEGREERKKENAPFSESQFQGAPLKQQSSNL